MSAIVNRLKAAQAAMSSTTGDTTSANSAPAPSTSTAPRTSYDSLPETSAFRYARVQHQVWQWKPNDTGLDMP